MVAWLFLAHKPVRSIFPPALAQERDDTPSLDVGGSPLSSFEPDSYRFAPHLVLSQNWTRFLPVLDGGCHFEHCGCKIMLAWAGQEGVFFKMVPPTWCDLTHPVCARSRRWGQAHTVSRSTRRAGVLGRCAWLRRLDLTSLG